MLEKKDTGAHPPAHSTPYFYKDDAGHDWVILHAKQQSTAQGYKRCNALFKFLQKQNLGVNTPKDIKVIEYNSESYGIMERFLGHEHSPERFAKATKPQQNKFVKQVADFFFKLHSIQLAGLPKNRDYIPYFKYDKSKPCEDVFLHSDFNYSNFLVDDDYNLHAVFDWDSCCIGPRIAEFCAFVYCKDLPMLPLVLCEYNKLAGTNITPEQVTSHEKARNPVIIGVTGLSGSGKSTYCRAMAKRGNFTLVEVDKYVHAALNEPEFISRAAELLGASWGDRRELGELVFASSRETIDDYNKLVWSFVEPQIDKILADAKRDNKDVIIEYLFLTITKFFDMCTKKVLVTRDDTERIKAAARRDGVDTGYITRRDKAFKFTFDEKDFDEIVRVNHKTRAFFAGTFDPFTLGHLDIARQAAQVFDEIVIGIGINSRKRPRTFPKRAMKIAIEKSLADAGITNARCVTYGGLTGERATKLGANFLVRGKRKGETDDFEDALQDYNCNSFGLETIYFTTELDIRSSRVPDCENLEILKTLVPDAVLSQFF